MKKHLKLDTGKGDFWYNVLQVSGAVDKTAKQQIYSDKPCAFPNLSLGSVRGFLFRWNMIIRPRKRTRWFKINTDAAQDKRLTYAARGLMAYLLSKPDNWEIKTQDLINNSPQGRTAVLAMLKELECCGYLQRKKTRSADGTFDWEINLHEEPESGLPTTVEPTTENPPIYKAIEDKEQRPRFRQRRNAQFENSHGDASEVAEMAAHGRSVQRIGKRATAALIQSKGALFYPGEDYVEDGL